MKNQHAPDYTYEIKPRPAELGGGWQLRVLEAGVEMGGGFFPASTEEESREAYTDAQATGDEWLASRPRPKE
jgi:hypothetical protein